MSRQEIQGPEIADQLESLLERYRGQIALHRLKTRSSTAELLVTVASDVLPQLALLRFGKAMKSFFEFRCRRIQLLETEMNMPGSEVAYITSAQERFSGRSK